MSAQVALAPGEEQGHAHKFVGVVGVDECPGRRREAMMSLSCVRRATSTRRSALYIIATMSHLYNGYVYSSTSVDAPCEGDILVAHPSASRSVSCGDRQLVGSHSVSVLLSPGAQVTRMESASEQLPRYSRTASTVPRAVCWHLAAEMENQEGRRRSSAPRYSGGVTFLGVREEEAGGRMGQLDTAGPATVTSSRLVKWAPAVRRLTTKLSQTDKHSALADHHALFVSNGGGIGIGNRDDGPENAPPRRELPCIMILCTQAPRE
ncbi:hypothetical protein EDB89DRAFT_1909828 [Lactarius sanguifluus]|nr:hypothetical protein EDB89DRAFT_1909828 [Lactarius sanguifluus]